MGMGLEEYQKLMEATKLKGKVLPAYMGKFEEESSDEY
jgi:hypothetical protein